MKQKTALLILGTTLSLVFPGKSVNAQCRDTDFPSGVLTAAPTRPVESSSPDPVQTGVVQTEAGWTHTFFSGNSSSDALSNLVKLGAWCNIEVRWNMASYLRMRSPGSVATGVGDNYFSAQYRFVRESRRLPSTAIGYSIKSATADAGRGMGTGYTDHALTLMFGKTVHGFTATSNATWFSMGKPGGGFNSKGEWTLAVSHAVYGRFGFTGEVYGDSTLNADNDAYANSTWLLTYVHRPWLIFDVGTGIPFTSGPGAPGKAVFGGVSYVVGSLYRAHK